MRQKTPPQNLFRLICTLLSVFLWAAGFVKPQPATADYGSSDRNSNEVATTIPVLGIASGDRFAAQSVPLPARASEVQSIGFDLNPATEGAQVITVLVPTSNPRGTQCERVLVDLSVGTVQVTGRTSCAEPSSARSYERSKFGVIASDVAFFLSSTGDALVVRPLEKAERDSRTSGQKGGSNGDGNYLIAFRDFKGALLAIAFKLDGPQVASGFQSFTADTTNYNSNLQIVQEPVGPIEPHHYACEDSKCVQRKGLRFSTCVRDEHCSQTACVRDPNNTAAVVCRQAGKFPINKCQNDQDCGVWHKECVKGDGGYKCALVPGQGKDDCAGDQDCNRKGKKCDLYLGFASCIENPDSPINSCVDRADCLTGLKCDGEGKCREGGTGDHCDNNKDCRGGTDEKHAKCNCRKGGVCELVLGPGKPECQSHYDCMRSCETAPPKYKTCLRNAKTGSFQCDYVDGRASDTCQSMTECLAKGHDKKCVVLNGSYRCIAQPMKGKEPVVQCDEDTDCMPTGMGTVCGQYLEGAPRCMQVSSTTQRQCKEDSECPIDKSVTSENATGSAKTASDQSMRIAAAFPWEANSIGEESAPLQIQIYQDTECGMCEFAFKNMVPEIVEQYVKPGRARITFHEYPLVPNTDGLDRAKALWCSAKQNKYGSLLAEVYAWDEKSKGPFILDQVAASAGLNIRELQRCIASTQANDFVSKSIREGKSLGIEGTPTIYVNGVVVGGAMPFDKMASILEEALSKRIGG